MDQPNPNASKILMIRHAEKPMKAIQRTAIIYLLLLLLLVSGCGPAASSLPHPAHVVIVIEENKSYEDVIGSPNAPYINGLAQKGASLTAFYAFHHPSQANYIELFAGTNNLTIGGEPYSVIDDTCAPDAATTKSLGGLLGSNFLGYGEGWDPNAPFACSGSGNYARKHLPWTGFKDSAAASRTFADFTNTSFDKLPQVSMIIPNLVDDMHSTPKGGSAEGNNTALQVKDGDTWLQQNLDAYAQWAMNNNSLLIVTWDESSQAKKEGSDKGTPFAPPKNHIPLILVGQMVKPGSTSSTTYNPYDLLRTIEDMYNLQPYLGGSAKAKDITGIWK